MALAPLAGLACLLGHRIRGSGARPRVARRAMEKIGPTGELSSRPKERESVNSFSFVFLNFPKQIFKWILNSFRVLNQTTQYKNSNAVACMHKHVARPYS